MNLEFNRLDSVHGEITLMAERADFQDKVEKELKRLAKTQAMPGFRVGHAPVNIIKKKYGTAVLYDVIERTVSEQLFDYINKEKLEVLGAPVQVMENLPDFEKDEQFVLRYKVGLAPEVNVKVDENLKIPYYNIKVTDKMVEDQSEALRQRFGRQIPGEEVEPNAVVKGVITELDENGNVKEDGIKVENGIVSPMYFKNEDQKALFIGKKVGEEFTFNPYATCDGNPAELASMLNVPKEDADKCKGDFRFAITEIIVLRPAELDQEYFDNLFGKDKVHNEEEYKEGVKNMIASSLQNDSNFRFTIDAKDALMKEAGEIDLPSDVLIEFLQRQNKDYTAEKAKEEYEKSEDALRWEIAADTVARQLDIKVEEIDVDAMARQVAMQQLMRYGISQPTPDMINHMAGEMMKQKEYRNEIASQARMTKIFNAVRAKASLEEKEVTVEEFNALFQNAE